MDRTPHEIVNPLSLSEPTGHAHTLVAAPGRTVHIGCQTARRVDGVIVGQGVVQQFDQALANMVEALRAVGARPLHVVDIRVHTTSMNTYRINLTALNSIYRRHMGRHSPPLTAVGVTELLDADALVEVMCTAVVPEPQDKTLLVDQVVQKVELSDELEGGAFETGVEVGAVRPQGGNPPVR